MVRAYLPADLPELLTIHRRAVHELARGEYSRAQLAAWAPDEIDPEAWGRRLASGGTFVAERRGRAAGFTRVETTGYLDLLYVHPDCARQGVGTELVEHAMVWCREQGVRKLFTDASDTGRPFFEDMGFRVMADQLAFRGGVRLRNWRMVRDLAG